ncbi:MAG: 30S ribosomal protein S5 [Candidatus Pacebacteria bacterium]|nr:30S ribosomal protein S5 [Candidatus Paceibacterota bacterium]MCD8508024.1 30S ribosomal protein S5 [Candidatus Paceibacterota bacterium]MCD8528338.1 30S ribosomal protein S5 [Candidatus Paceibacterota bacterium]MCD8563804.1 30S ribosomal protein S5 [Candidatus Paceibacterota bacterium]
MSEETVQTQQAPAARAPRGGARQGDGKRPARKPFNKGKQPERQKPEFDQKIISIRRVTRVMAGGRRFSFSVAMVIGDKNGSVGVGLGKAGDTALAIQKAINQAKKTMITIMRTDEKSIPHEVEAKFNAAQLMMMPNYGRGLVAGSAVRSVLELAGITDVTAKISSRTKNQINIARAALKALEPISRPYTKKSVVAGAGEGAASLSEAPARA